MDSRLSHHHLKRQELEFTPTHHQSRAGPKSSAYSTKLREPILTQSPTWMILKAFHWLYQTTSVKALWPKWTVSLCIQGSKIQHKHFKIKKESQSRDIDRGWRVLIFARVSLEKFIALWKHQAGGSLWKISLFDLLLNADKI